jgi:hypothetical protein
MRSGASLATLLVLLALFPLTLGVPFFFGVRDPALGVVVEVLIVGVISVGLNAAITKDVGFSCLVSVMWAAIFSTLVVVMVTNFHEG